MSIAQFDKDGTLKGRVAIKEVSSPFAAVAMFAGCAILGFLIPTCGVLCFTNWLDPLFR